jgi:hypothetical protein
MTENEIAETKLKGVLLQTMKRSPGIGVRVTIESFVAAAELGYGLGVYRLDARVR